MTLPVSLTIPYCAGMTTNGRLAPGRGKSLRLSRKYRDAKAHAVEHVMVGAAGHSPTDEPVELEIVSYWPDDRNRDVDAPIKLVQDALIGYVIEDDAQVQRVTAEKAGVDSESPRIEVQVQRMEEQADE